MTTYTHPWWRPLHEHICKCGHHAGFHARHLPNEPWFMGHCGFIRSFGPGGLRYCPCGEWREQVWPTPCGHCGGSGSCSRVGADHGGVNCDDPQAECPHCREQEAMCASPSTGKATGG